MKDDGGSAFPIIPPIDSTGSGSAGGYPYPETGLSIRDYFAAKAMQALVGAVSTNGTAASIAKEFASKSDRAVEQEIAASAYALADFMLAERAKP